MSFRYLPSFLIFADAKTARLNRTTQKCGDIFDAKIITERHNNINTCSLESKYFAQRQATDYRRFEASNKHCSIVTHWHIRTSLAGFIVYTVRIHSHTQRRRTRNPTGHVMLCETKEESGSMRMRSLRGWFACRVRRLNAKVLNQSETFPKPKHAPDWFSTPGFRRRSRDVGAQNRRGRGVALMFTLQFPAKLSSTKDFTRVLYCTDSSTRCIGTATSVSRISNAVVLKCW